MQSLIYHKRDFHPVIYKIIGINRFTTHSSLKRDGKIEKISNKLGRDFKNNAKIRKTNIHDQTKCFKRIYRRDLFWKQNQKTDFENQQSF